MTKPMKDPIELARAVGLPGVRPADKSPASTRGQKKSTPSSERESGNSSAPLDPIALVGVAEAEAEILAAIGSGGG